MTGCLYVYPASVHAVHDELTGVINLEWGVEDRDWGKRELVLRDPNGSILDVRRGHHRQADVGRRIPPHAARLAVVILERVPILPIASVGGREYLVALMPINLIQVIL